MSSKETRKKPELSWPLLILPVVLILLLISIALTAVIIFQRGNSDLSLSSDNTISSLYTQGAQTVVVKLTKTASASIISALLPGSPPLVATFTTRKTMSPIEQTLGIQPSYTPWPRDKFPNPEQFVKDYFNAINSKDFERSWSMLSIQFQQSCCNVGGNDPFLVYKNYWENVTKIEVLSAYLQEWDSNPARLIVSLRYFYHEGKPLESVYVFWLISNPINKTLEIFEVK